MKNVYIHIPFCKSKCRYCSFVSYPKSELKEKYLNALTKEIRTRYQKETLDTLYFGGGTPSLLSYNELNELIKLFNTNDNTEITLEANPETITKEYLIYIKNCGINRLSFGCQTFDNTILKLIGRIHTAEQVKNAIYLAQNTGFDNINLDLIYGLPKQTLEIFENDLNTAVSTGVRHISLYGLKIEENCYFYKNPPESLPDNDMQADMYLKAISFLENNHFEHYEISNFAKNDLQGKSYRSKHNLNYWNNNSYYGFGVAAHGYENGIRYNNTENIEEYISIPTEHQAEHRLTEQEKLEEEIFLGFRKTSGINVEQINQKYNINFCKKYKNTIDKYIKLQYLTETNAGYKLSNNGILVSNIILSEFLD